VRDCAPKPKYREPQTNPTLETTTVGSARRLYQIRLASVSESGHEKGNTPMSDKGPVAEQSVHPNGEDHKTTSDDDFGKRSACQQIDGTNPQFNGSPRSTPIF
jgi:hypothetical protein